MLSLRTAQGLSLTDFVRYSISSPSSSSADGLDEKSGLGLAVTVDGWGGERREEALGAARSVIMALLPYIESRHVEVYAIDSGSSSGHYKRLITLTHDTEHKNDTSAATSITTAVSVNDIINNLQSVLHDDALITSNIHSNPNNANSGGSKRSSSIDYRICLTDPKGFLLSNTVISAVFRVLAGGTGDL